MTWLLFSVSALAGLGLWFLTKTEPRPIQKSWICPYCCTDEYMDRVIIQPDYYAYTCGNCDYTISENEEVLSPMEAWFE